jgi:hypothetical protein
MLALVVASVAIAAGAAGAFQARSHRRTGTEVLHLRFHRDGFASNVLLLSGQYAFVPRPESGRRVTGTLIDDRTGKRTSIVSPVGCYPTVIGGGWLLFRCDGLTLYSLASGAWRSVPRVAGLSGPASPDAPIPVAVGSRWIEFDTRICEFGGSHCSNDQYVFESLQTGKVSKDPTSATTVADLNSPSLGRKVCSPLRVPKANVGSEEDVYRWAARPGTMTFYASSVMANGMFHDGTTGLFLERCRSHLHKFIDLNIYDPPAVAANSHLVVRQTRTDQLSGLWLSGLRPSVIPLPAAVHLGPPPNNGGILSEIDLSSRTLYVVNQGGQLWTARTPSR